MGGGVHAQLILNENPSVSLIDPSGGSCIKFVLQEESKSLRQEEETVGFVFFSVNRLNSNIK
jgi:hypothetical protein